MTRKQRCGVEWEIGDRLGFYGKLVMIGYTGGERYYWCISKSNVISMIPASVVKNILIGVGI